MRRGWGGHIWLKKITARHWCVCERERGGGSQCSVVCVCVRVWERETRSSNCKHIRASSLCLSRDSVPVSGPDVMVKLWTDGKTKDIINCLYMNFESWSSRLWYGALHFRLVLVVFGQSQCSGSVGQSEQTVLVGKEELCGKRSVWERRGIPTIMYSIWNIICFLTLKHVNIFCYTKYTE